MCQGRGPRPPPPSMGMGAPPHGMFDGSCPASMPRGIAPSPPCGVDGWLGGWVDGNIR